MHSIHKTLGGRLILKGVSLEVPRGALTVLIRPSGAGKSTFLQCVNHLIPPDSGDVYLNGEKLDASDKKSLSLFRQQVGMIF
jgi:polar amino acid transport system ATP-binding protein